MEAYDPYAMPDLANLLPALAAGPVVVAYWPLLLVFSWIGLPG